MVVPIFCRKLEKRLYFAKEIPKYGKAYDKALTYANAKHFVITELNFVKVRLENN